MNDNNDTTVRTLHQEREPTVQPETSIAGSYVSERSGRLDLVREPGRLAFCVDGRRVSFGPGVLNRIARDLGQEICRIEQGN